MKLFFQIRLPHDLPSPVFDQHRFKAVFLIRQVLERVTCDWGGGGMLRLAYDDHFRTKHRPDRKRSHKL
ncbi:hypothetical protein [Mesorhizobium escarrei]|uniref:hypothetical protein n=1 Tax=Mesorhizobium escarrei TaxID=666018 RepID=UPI003F52D155